ncbi:MAG: SDR family oxidoreductase [Pseudomonadales bacterium]
MSNFKDHVYIITGGSQGFGFAIAQELVREGAKVGLIARSGDRLNEAVVTLGEDKAYAVVADIANGAQVKQAFAEIHQHFGRLDGLVNNAGVARPGTIEEIPEHEMRLQFDVNVIGLVLCCQAAIPLLRDSPNPRIVNIGSASARYREEIRHLGIYAATKIAVERLTAEMRDEIKADGIGVTLVVPGAAMTEFAAGWNEQRLRKAVGAWQEQGPNMDSGMEPHHVAEAVVHCLGYKPGVAIDELIVRPNSPTPKFQF